jgi:hypothetical protein
MRRGAKISSGLALAALMLTGMFQAAEASPIHRFLAYYEAMQKTEAPLDFWERVAASFVLTRAEQARQTAPQTICSRTSSL